MQRSSRGLSLSELVTVAVLLLLTLCVLAQVLLPTAYMASVAGARSEVQQGALVFIHTIRRGLLSAPADTVSVTSDPTAISFATISEEDPFDVLTASPKLVPRFTILWYDRSEQKVMARTWPPGPPALGGYDFTDPARPPVLSEADLGTITTAGSGRVLVRSVESLLIEDSQGVPNGSALVYPLRFTITCAARTSRPHATEDDKERYTLTTCLSPGCLRW